MRFLRTLVLFSLILFTFGTLLSCRPEIRGADDSSPAADTGTGGGSGGSGSTTTTSVTWSFVDGGGSGGINKDHARYAQNVQLTSFNSKLYSTWQENNTSNISQTRVAVYNSNDSSPSWAFVDVNGSNGLNKDTSRVANTPQITVFNSKLYATWSEANAGGVTQIRAAVYNGNDAGPSWAFIDGNGADGINKDTARSASKPQLTSFNSKLYATWVESNAGAVTQIRVAVYNGNDGGPTWTFVDGNGANGINKSAASNATTPQLISFNSNLYAIWAENVTAQIRVAVYNGNDGAPTWTFVDGGGTAGINKDPTQSASNPQTTVFNSKLYASWQELGAGRQQIRVAVYNGNDSAPSWSLIDGNAATGLNKDTTNHASNPKIAAIGSELFATWSELDSLSAGQIRIALYNGNDSSPSWSFKDGNGAEGINKSTLKPAQSPKLILFNSNIYITWDEQTAASPGEIMMGLGLRQ